MSLFLKRSSLATQVADAIRGEALRGAWGDWLPSERRLCRTLDVSRNTCHEALLILNREGLVTPVPGRGVRLNRRVAAARKRSARTRSIGLIIPESIGQLQPRTSILIDELRRQAFDLGIHVELHDEPVCYQPKADRAVEKLVARHHHDCWILFVSQEPLQKWFMERQIPCLVAGTVYPHIKLPSVGVDHRASCRHAAGTLLGLGHRHLVMLTRRSRTAADLESESGFLEGVSGAAPAGVEGHIVYHGESRPGVRNVIAGLFSGSDHPTGLLVSNSYYYLSVALVLAQRGIRIPADVSAISRDSETFLAYLDPEPARYLAPPSIHARKIMALAQTLLQGGTARLEPVRIVPKFVRGASCARANPGSG